MMPKLPPPPRIAQNRSGFSASLARTRCPSAVTISALIRLSAVSPNLRLIQPKPPPSVNPAMPVVELIPVGVISPNDCASRSNSPKVSGRGGTGLAGRACQGAAARDWLAAREADLLPVGYFHVV